MRGTMFACSGISLMSAAARWIEASITQQFDRPGTYQYFCQPHGAPGLVGMAATVVVD
jgi:plastocyanin